MLVISPIQEKEVQKKLCETFGAEYRENDFAYVANVDEEPTVLCQFAIRGGNCEIHDLLEAPGKEDFEAMFLTGRQTLNFCDLCGAHDAYLLCEDRVCDRVRAAVGFKKTEKGYYMDLRGFFNEPCKHTD